MIRQQIIDELINRFSQISVVNGYNTDVKKVKEWDIGNFDEEDLPAIIIRDQNSTDIELTNIEHQHILRVSITGLVKSSTAVSDIRKLQQDIYKAIAVDTTWNGLAKYTKPSSSQIVAQYQDVKASGIEIDIEISYITKAWEL